MLRGFSPYALTLHLLNVFSSTGETGTLNPVSRRSYLDWREVQLVNQMQCVNRTVEDLTLTILD